MTDEDEARRAAWTAWLLVAVKVGLHLVLIARHGIHRDELYFVECGRRLAFGYVDHPPFVPFVAAIARVLAGSALPALRLLPVLAGGTTVWLTSQLVRGLGGRWRAVLVAGLAVLIAPAYLRMGTLLCIPVFEPVFWTLASLLVLRILDGASPRLWLWVGLVVGVGLLNKHSMLLWIAGMGVGLLITSARGHLRSPYVWAGLGVAAAIFAPNAVWQAQHEFATVEFLRTMSSDVLGRIPRSLFLLGQLLFMNPFTLPIWAAGLTFFFTRRGARYRPLGVGFLVVVLALFITHAKPYYLAPAFPVLFAAGAVQIERRLAPRRHGGALLAAGTSLMAVGGVVLGLVALPILPVPVVDRALGATLGWIVRPDDLTLELHDEHGWREQAAVIGRVVGELTPEDRAVAVVLTGNYGEASAIQYFGASAGLPPAISGHMTYFLWGPSPGRGEVAIAYGVPRASLIEMFADVREVARIDHPVAMPRERDLPVFLCRSPRTPMVEAWPRLKVYTHVPEPASGGR